MLFIICEIDTVHFMQMNLLLNAFFIFHSLRINLYTNIKEILSAFIKHIKHHIEKNNESIKQHQ